MTKIFKFLSDDIGAVTVDWVAVTAGILLLGIMVVFSIFNGGVSSLVSDISATLAGVETDIDTGSAPNMNGGSGDMVLASGDTLPLGSQVVDNNGDDLILVVTPGGVGIIVQTTPGAAPGIPNGSTVSGNNTLTQPDGGGSTSATDAGLVGIAGVIDMIDINPT